MLSLIYYIFLVAMGLTMLVLTVIARIVIVPFDPARKVIHQITRVMTCIFYGGPFYWKKIIIGRENLDPNKSYVVAINHQSMMDIPTLYLLNFNFRWVSKREVFNIPLFGQFLFLHGDIAIERGNARVAMEKVISDGCKWLSRGASVAIFPEGTRSKDGEIGRFKVGAFNLAKAADVEILPIVMTGTKKAFNKGFFFNWGNETTMKVLPPISREVVAATEAKELMAMVQGEMVEALKTIRK